MVPIFTTRAYEGVDTWMAVFEKRGRASLIDHKIAQSTTQEGHKERAKMAAFWGILLLMLSIAAAQGERSLYD